METEKKSIDDRSVYCPVCGEWCVLEYKKSNIPDSIYYWAGNCNACKQKIVIADGSSYSQEGIITIEYS